MISTTLSTNKARASGKPQTDPLSIRTKPPLSVCLNGISVERRVDAKPRTTHTGTYITGQTASHRLLARWERIVGPGCRPDARNEEKAFRAHSED